MRFHEIQCPSCFEKFEVAGPEAGECPAEWDYDCEICCRPMVLIFESDEYGDVAAGTRSLND